MPVPDLLARYHSYAAVGVFILSLLKPATIIFRNTIKDTLVLPEVGDIMSSTNNAGRMIGNMERLIIGTALIAGQYTGIALVLAAKTIARHKQLEDQVFAEYYLIGTLYSILYTIIMYVLIVQPVLS